MGVDVATVARRRHTATMLLRAALLLWIGYTAVQLVQALIAAVQGILGGGYPIGAFVYEVVIPLVFRIALAAAVMLIEGPLVRWLVPIGQRENSCPRCGYALKDLKSPVCPECGLNMQAGAQGPTPGGGPRRA